jgi:DNA-binding NarL/FixJ family response regulator
LAGIKKLYDLVESDYEFSCHSLFKRCFVHSIHLIMNNKQILICDDHPIFRYGLRIFLEKNEFIVFEAATTEEAIARAVKIIPHLIIMDYILPSINGIKAIEIIRRKLDKPKILLLSNVHEKELSEKCREMDIDGYCTKNESLETINSVIFRILAGEKVFIEPSEYNKGAFPPGNPFEVLTQREIEIVRMLVTGETQKVIASKLNISLRTMEKHRSNITAKLGKMSLSTLTRKAFAWGLVHYDGLTSGYQ